MIKERLPEAVQQCIHAAAGEHEPAIQRGLLRVSIVSEVVMVTTCSLCSVATFRFSQQPAPRGWGSC